MSELPAISSHPPARPRFVVVGPGALGSVVGARLARAGTDVTLLGRDTPHLRAIRDYGLTVKESDGQEERIDIAASARPSVVAAADFVLVLVKTEDTGAAMSGIAPFVQPHQVLLTMQNGLGSVDRIRQVLGAQPCVLPAVTWQAATRLAPGVVLHAGTGPTAIGYHTSLEQVAAAEIATLFSRADLPASIVPDIERLIWQKVAINAAINGLTALGSIRNGDIATQPELLDAAVILAEEAAAVGRATGVPMIAMRDAVFETAVATAQNTSSMLQDLAAGRRTEVEAIHGAILRQAAAVGVPVPALSVVTALIRARERSGQEIVEDHEHRGE